MASSVSQLEASRSLQQRLDSTATQLVEKTNDAVVLQESCALLKGLLAEQQERFQKILVQQAIIDKCVGCTEKRCTEETEAKAGISYETDLGASRQLCEVLQRQLTVAQETLQQLIQEKKILSEEKHETLSQRTEEQEAYKKSLHQLTNEKLTACKSLENLKHAFHTLESSVVSERLNQASETERLQIDLVAAGASLSSLSCRSTVSMASTVAAIIEYRGYENDNTLPVAGVTPMQMLLDADAFLCCACQVSMSKICFSKAQLSKPASVRRCKDCVENLAGVKISPLSVIPSSPMQEGEFLSPAVVSYLKSVNCDKVNLSNPECDLRYENSRLAAENFKLAEENSFLRVKEVVTLQDIATLNTSLSELVLKNTELKYCVALTEEKLQSINLQLLASVAATQDVMIQVEDMKLERITSDTEHKAIIFSRDESYQRMKLNFEKEVESASVLILAACSERDASAAILDKNNLRLKDQRSIISKLELLNNDNTLTIAALQLLVENKEGFKSPLHLENTHKRASTKIEHEDGEDTTAVSPHSDLSNQDLSVASPPDSNEGTLRMCMQLSHSCHQPPPLVTNSNDPTALFACPKDALTELAAICIRMKLGLRDFEHFIALLGNIDLVTPHYLFYS